MKELKEMLLQALIVAVLFGLVLFIFDTVSTLIWRFMAK
mgnify:CR=1 FL=1